MSGQPDMPLPVTSSFEPEFTTVQASLYREVLLLFNEHQIPYAVSGAFALQQHTGIWRVTKDLDLFLTSETVPGALRLLRERGYHCEVCDPVWLAKAHRDDFFVDMITGMSNAAITVTDSWIARARPAVVVGVDTRVLAPEELLASKVFVTRRERFDGADIAHVVYGTQGQMDWERIFEVLGEHWEMLLYGLVLFRYVYPAQTHYVPNRVWQELLTRFTEAVRHPDQRARFRGSLIDDNMFAIDMNEWGMDNILAEYRAQRVPKLDWTAECDDPDCKRKI